MRDVLFQGGPPGDEAFRDLGAGGGDGAQGDAEAAVHVQAVAGSLLVQDALVVDGQLGRARHPAHGQVPPGRPAQAAAHQKQRDVLVEPVVVAWTVERGVGEELAVLGQAVPEVTFAYVLAEADQHGGAQRDRVLGPRPRAHLAAAVRVRGPVDVGTQLDRREPDEPHPAAHHLGHVDLRELVALADRPA
ncbi:hypothetical protein OUY22_17090 [Nonomuraea sp. MCN248]|uniref:Uncharacterized protein n=1 Tax=Nonomuraea corallina TaxID=2989783 RepID=A0ABT4SD51_9ACTN|nr:hypothetical protein [Nonomuraea corallina]MDA0635136.1 hypothetical protein [Nonomuraea corallina]